MSSGYSTSPSRTPRRQQRSSSPAANGLRSPSPAPQPRNNKIGIERLTKNVTREHLEEIFGVYGQIVDIFLPMRNGANKGFSHITFASEEGAQRAIRHMDKGQLDGNVLEVALWVPREPRRRPSHQPQRRPYSPPRRHQAPRPRSPPRYRPRSPSAYNRRSPYRSPYSPAHYRRRSPPPPSPYRRHRRPSVSRTPRRDSVSRTPRRRRSISRTPRRQRSISRTPRRHQQRSPPRSPSRTPRRQRSVSRTPPRRRYSRSRTPPRRPYY